MAKVIIEPKSGRSAQALEKIQERFPQAVEGLRNNGPLEMTAMHMGWNPTILNPAGKKIGYTLGSEYGASDEKLRGEIRDTGRGCVGVGSYNANLIGCSTFSNTYVFQSLAEAIKVASKLDVKHGLSFLPDGKREQLEQSLETPTVKEVLDPEHAVRYQTFMATLIDRSEKIIASKVNGVFEKYLVAQMPSGLYVAHSAFPGQATYIVTELEDLLRTKEDLGSSNDAIIVRRDNRIRWEDKVMNEAS